MLAWMNHTSQVARALYGREVFIKVHVAQGETCPDIMGPTGQPLNFNFLPQFADPGLAVAAHTVETYVYITHRDRDTRRERQRERKRERESE